MEGSRELFQGVHQHGRTAEEARHRDGVESGDFLISARWSKDSAFSWPDATSVDATNVWPALTKPQPQQTFNPAVLLAWVCAEWVMQPLSGLEMVWAG